MRALEAALLGGIALVALALAGLGLFHYGYGPMVIAFPLGLAAVLAGLCLLRAAQLARPADAGAGAEAAAVEPPGWPAVAWIAAAPLCVLLFGFALGLALFGAAFARGHGARLRVALPLGIGVLLAIEVLFAGLLGLSGTGLPDWWPVEIRAALPQGLAR